MRQLKDVARYVRSKNAGPFWVTVDIFCDNRAAFDTLSAACALQPGEIARLYEIQPVNVRIFPNPDLNVIKISFPRPVIAGAFQDRDAHAGQYFVPLLSVHV